MRLYDKELDFIDNYKPASIDRRGFLGSVIGFFTATQIPWIAKEPNEEIIQQPETILKDFKTFVSLTDGRIIQGPGVQDIIDGSLKLFDINVVKPTEFKGSIIFYKKKLLSNMNFHVPQFALNGDTLKITHDINIIIKPGDKNWDKYF